MLYKYALEPSLLSSWSDFRFLISQFGYDRGRLIARFPKRWKRMVHESLGQCKDIERARIVEALSRIDSRMESWPGSTWEPDRDWLANAESEHRKRPFRAIIAETNVRAHPDVIVGESLTEDDSRPLWQAARSKVINRNAEEMADAIDPFIKRADTIMFVDKHFCPERSKYHIPFKAFLSRLSERTAAQMPKTLAVHYSSKDKVGLFRSKSGSQLAAMIPAGVKVQFHRWEFGDLHNRFVLTDIGGVTFGEGLDQYDGNVNGRPEDVVVLLDIKFAQQLILDYTPGESRFRHMDCCEITGTRTH